MHAAVSPVHNDAPARQVTFGQQLLAGLCGGNPRLRSDLEDVVYSAEGRYRLRTRSSGTVMLQLAVVRQDYAEPVIEQPLASPTHF